MHKVVVGVGSMLIVWLLTAGVASAASLTADRSSVAAGGTVVVSGSCQAGGTGFVISSAFLHDATHDFAGVGAVPFTADASGNFSASAIVPATTPAGPYSITARCGGGNLGITLALAVTSTTLPFTGSHVSWALLGVVLVAAGSVVTAVGRRRPLRQSAPGTASASENR